MMTPWAAPDIVADARTGDRAAIERLIAEIWPGCVRLSASLIGDVALAQDAAQEACGVVYRKVAGLRQAAAFDAWLYRIVLREASRIRRRHAAARSWSGDLVQVTDDTATIDVWQALATLPPSLREVAVLFYMDDLAGETIAAILRIPHATVRTRAEQQFSR